MAMRSTKRLGWQSGQRVVFAEVTVSVEKRREGEWSFAVPDDCHPSWAMGALFGAAKFREALNSTSKGYMGAHVKIENVVGQPVDTTETAVAYVTFQALCAAMDERVEKVFSFDSATGTFVVGQRHQHE